MNNKERCKHNFAKEDCPYVSCQEEIKSILIESSDLISRSKAIEELEKLKSNWPFEINGVDMADFRNETISAAIDSLRKL